MTTPYLENQREQIEGFEMYNPVERARKVQGTYQIKLKGGWMTIFSGEDTRRGIDRALIKLESQNVRVVCAVPDQWSIWTKFGCIVILILTLGFIGRKPSVILICEPK